MSDNLYFEPSSRLQLVDKLAHLLRFSNAFLVLTGPNGAGSTTVLEQLHNRAIADDFYIVSLALEADTSLRTLLDKLNAALGELVDLTEQTSDPLSALDQRVAAITRLQRKIFISLDNCDHLTNDGIITLLNLLVANQGMIAIVVAGTQTLAARSSDLAQQEGVSEHHYIEVLHPFNRLETEEFIQLNFVRGSDFSARQISAIYANTEGYPGRITEITSQMIKSGKVTLNSKFGLLPLPHMLGIAFLLTAITSVLAWQSISDEDQDQEIVKQDSFTSQQLAINVDEEISLGLELDEHNDRARTLEDEIASLSNEIKSQQALIESVEQSDTQSSAVDLANQLSLVDSEEILDADGDEQQRSENETTQLPINSFENADADVAADTQDVDQEIDQLPLVELAKEAGSNLADNTQTKVKNVESDNKTVVNAAVVKRESVKKVDEKQVVVIKLKNLSEQLQKNIDHSYLQTIVPEQTLNKGVIIKESSVTAKKQVISTSSKVKPTVVSKEIQNIQLKPTTARVSASTAVQNWPASSYTLQLISARSKSNISQFMQSMPNAEKMHYLQTQVKGRPWHVVIYGQYANRAQANAAIAKLPAKLRALKPWPKSVSSVKNTIKK
jgi:septal ring-binding cell division protein DamX/type II secretory pathway predicted ATPase ExeA